MAYSMESQAIDGEDGTAIFGDIDEESSPLMLDTAGTRQPRRDQDGWSPDHLGDIEGEVRRLKRKLREEQARRCAELASIERLREQKIQVDSRNQSLSVAKDEVMKEIEVERGNIANWKLEVEKNRMACASLETEIEYFKKRAERLEKKMAHVKKELNLSKLSCNAAPEPARSTQETPQRKPAPGASTDDHAMIHPQESPAADESF